MNMAWNAGDSRKWESAERFEYFEIEGNMGFEDDLLLEKGFFVLLCLRGEAVVSDRVRSYRFCCGDLLILTPSMTGRLPKGSEDIHLSCLYIVPWYFDSLSDGQPMYDQFMKYLGHYQLPILHLERSACEHLKSVAALFPKCTEEMFRLHGNGIGRHLCSLYLLMIADILYRDNRPESARIDRSSEIFRQFKKLLVEHYREQHDIAYYAGQLNISTTYLSRMVKKVTGRTVYSHLAEFIGSDAKKLLECTDLDVKEIADILGFSDQSVFGKFFRRKTGISPLKYRLRNERKALTESPRRDTTD